METAKEQFDMRIRWRRAIAIYEILTFVVIVWDVALTLVDAPARVPAIYIVSVLALCGAGVSLVAGLCLWRDASRGRLLSLLVQAVQMPHIVLPGFLGFSVALGLSVVIGIGHKPPIIGSPVHLLLVGGRSMQGVYLVLYGGGGEARYLGLNILALVAWTGLIKWAGFGALHERSRPNARREG